MAPDQSTDPLDTFRKHKYLSLTTYRKSGEGVPTPVWFTIVDDKLYVKTGKQAGKAKRIRRNPAVEIAPCTNRGKLRGPAIRAVAHDVGANPDVDAAFGARYGFQERIRNYVLRRRNVEATILEIALTR